MTTMAHRSATAALPDGRYVPVNGVATYVREGGLPGGPPVILLHGFMTSSSTWRSVWPELATEFHLYAPDLPGYGESQTLRAAGSLDAFATFLDRLFDVLALERAAVVGTAMGGSIAGWFASRHPERVERLVLMAAGALGETSANMWLYRLTAARGVGRVIARLMPRSLFARRLRAAYGRPEGPPDGRPEIPSDAVVDEYFRTVRRRGEGQARIGLQVRAGYGPGYETAMRRVSAPTLLIWGENDRIVPLATAYRFRAAIRGARLTTIPHCGDFPQEEAAPVVARAIADFLAETPTQETSPRGGSIND